MPPASKDPLSEWLCPDTCRAIRNWPASTSMRVSHEVLLLAAMRVVKELTADLVGSNPTWVRSPTPAERISAPALAIARLTHHHDALCTTLEAAPPVLRKPRIALASAHRIPAPTNSIGITLTSPPYLTRIDYVEIADANTLRTIRQANRNTVIALAVFFGKTRLIDNLRLR